MSLELVVKVEATDLVNALREFVAVMTGKPSGVIPVPGSVVVAPVIPAPAQAAPTVPVQVPTAPVQTPPVQTAASVPTTAAPTYTLDQLAVAATSLVDAGRRQEIVSLLGTFGVAALTQLPKERYGEFATALRQMGAKI